MERDEHGFENARVQYRLDETQTMPICPQSSVCFELKRHYQPQEKRAKFDAPGVPYMTANAHECDKEHLTVVGISVSDSTNVDAIKKHPLAAGRVTVQCAGIADIATPKLHHTIQIGHYVCVDVDAPVQTLDGLPKEFGVFALKKVGFMTKREHVIGRVCGIRLAVQNQIIVRVVMSLQAPAPAISIPLASTLTEESVFETYVPPALLHTMWRCVTPANVEEQTNTQSQDMLKTLQTVREDALKTNTSLANMLDRAINEVEFTEVSNIIFPTFENMSVMGVYAFLIGTHETRGVLWYAQSLQDAKDITAEILLLAPESSGRMDYAASTVYKSDDEFSLFERFQMWSKRHYQHTYQPLLHSIRTCFAEAVSVYEGSA